jgi:type IV pilus assembly protein PilP
MMVLAKNNFSQIKRRAVSISFCCLALGLSGCVNDDVSDLEQYAQTVKAKPKGTIPLLPEIKVVEPFLFNPDGLRNPFQPVERIEQDDLPGVASGSGIRPDSSRRKEELEAYSLDALRMVGTVMMGKGKWALIKASDGTIHRIQKGNHMGRNYGEIIQILDNRIELMEIVPDKPGSWREQQASIVLAE